jgi:hypothetical protein
MKSKQSLYILPVIVVALLNNWITEYVNPIILAGVLVVYMGFLVFTKKLELKSPTVILFIGFVLVSEFLYFYYKI